MLSATDLLTSEPKNTTDLYTRTSAGQRVLPNMLRKIEY